MKHTPLSILLILLAILAGNHLAGAQCSPSLSSCTLRVSTDPLCMVPDTNEMHPGYVGVPYDRSIHFIFESSITVISNPQTGDSLPFPITATMQYMTFDSLSGLPPGISYEMYSGNPQDPPGRFSPDNGNKAHGCIFLYGTPTEANTPSTNGAFIHMKPNGCVLGGTLCGDFPWTVTYRMPIELAGGIKSEEADSDLKVTPLSTGSVQVDFDIKTNCTVQLQIIDLTGKVLRDESLNTKQGRNQTILPFSNPSGLYILRVTTPYGLSTKRFAW